MFTEAFDHVIGVEGGYVNDPNDSGGETKYGITVAVARRHGYEGAMIDLPLEFARRVYQEEYWDKMRCGAIASYGLEELALKMFDAGVNVGVGRAVKWLQLALNLLNAGDPLFVPLAVDGDLGNRTLQALRVFQVRAKGDSDATLVKVINGRQVCHYLDLAGSRPKDKRFLFGWLRARVTNHERVR